MAKRRTRKQKEGAKHAFTISWQPGVASSKPEAKTASNEPVVKGQKKKAKKAKNTRGSKNKHAENTDKYGNLGTIRRDIVKSILLASLILSLELVIYLIW